MAAGAPSSKGKKKGEKEKNVGAEAQALTPEERDDRATRQQMLEALAYGSGVQRARGGNEHRFWNTQPVAQDATELKNEEHGPFEVKTLADVSKDPYPLPDQFVWSDCDVQDPKTLDEVYSLLSKNYVEDGDSVFRFDYSREFLLWALTPPGFTRTFHIGVRVKDSAKLVGFITGIPCQMRVYDKTMPMVEINFLCVHKKLRSKRLAPMLIKEVTRRVNLTNVWQAVYTAGVVIPHPISRNRYWHRSLNPKKLVEVGFSRLRPNTTMALMIKLYKLPESPATPGLRPMEAKDVPQVHGLLAKYLSKFKLAPELSQEDTAHWLLPRPNVIYSYVVEDPQSHAVTDIVSFYSLPSSILNNPKHSHLSAAYSYYNVYTKTPLKQLMGDALVLAKNAGFDVFNALDLMENATFFDALKFGIGDGNLQYYVYNWRCPEMKPADVGLVLL